MTEPESCPYRSLSVRSACVPRLSEFFLYYDI